MKNAISVCYIIKYYTIFTKSFTINAYNITVFIQEYKIYSVIKI